ncbi:hypothetical protein [Streptomyces sp. NBC_00236]|uniref:hypothetical protein n=1 Tax=unclassified Streptomyces TaxID=2593676 RepID=UPI002E2B77EC|nr:hypothetical protein [Streptomyces sp. NBC_00236]
MRFDRRQDFDLGGYGVSRLDGFLVSVVLAGIPDRNAGAAGGVLSTVNQIGGAVGMAVLGTVFFTRAAGSTTGPPTLIDDSRALGAVLLISAGLYVITALVMPALPKSAAAHDA